MDTKTLWTLSKQPLPGPDSKADAVFVFIWWFFSASLAYGFHFLAHKPSPTWPEFRYIGLGTILLFFSYSGLVFDRFLHTYHVAAPCGYIVFPALWEFFLVGSTNLILWGTYTLVWKEVESRFAKKTQGILWFAAKFVNLLVFIVSLFYTILNLVLSIVWVEFVNLNAIADIATKRNDFELAMATLFFGCSLLTAGVAAAAIWRARHLNGKVRKTRGLLFLATILLLARYILQLAFVAQVYRGAAKRQNQILAKDVSYGALSIFQLISLAFIAWSVTRSFDMGSNDAELVGSDIRNHILETLREETNSGRQQSPRFEDLLRDVENKLDIILATGPLSSSLSMERDDKRKAAMECIAHLRARYGELDPKEGKDYSSLGSRNGSALSSIFRKSGFRTPSNSDFPMDNITPGVPRVKSREMLNRFTTRQHPPVSEE
ncbi:hypothetical protein AK830_g2314 [Neonectria ditissima]|uniref:Uncharacterized protein n=1 Tax=Neonectria ditissima TaxID=78410 RepID=A0A0P7B3C4_9HYPO|nr:hypothetical protein AK830_g2314 [Neonectria ditissima]